MPFSTASDIIGQAHSLTKTDGQNTKVPGIEADQMLKQLNRYNAEFVLAPYNSGGTGWNWMRGDIAFEIADSTTTNGAASVGDTTLTLSSIAGLDSSGAILIEGSDYHQVVFYDSIVGLTLQGVSIDSPIATGTKVSKLNKLPADFRRLRSNRRGYSVYVNNCPMRLVSEDPYSGQFSILRNGDDQYLWLNSNQSGTVQVMYDKEPTLFDPADTTTFSSQVNVPVEYDDFLVYRLVAHVHRILFTNVDRAVEWDEKADEALRRAFKQRSQGKRVKLLTDQPTIHPSYYYNGSTYV